MTRLVVAAVDEKRIAKLDAVFFAGEVATHMYFLCTGEISYIPYDHEMDDFAENDEVICTERECWITDEVLWVEEWFHCGILSAVEDCTILAMKSETFCEITKRFQEVIPWMRQY